MKVGCPKEIKPQEFRVGLTPVAVRELVGRGHNVTIETNAGLGSGFGAIFCGPPSYGIQRSAPLLKGSAGPSPRPNPSAYTYQSPGPSPCADCPGQVLRPRRA